MEGFLKTIDLLEIKLISLIKKLEDLRENNTNLNQENRRLLDNLSLKNNIITDLEDKLKAKRIANTMVGSKEDKLITKQKISSLIRDIDKCITLVSDK